MGRWNTLYVSDLDGTLLRSNEITSEYTNSVINNLTDKGMIFSYATARSFITAKKVTEGVILRESEGGKFYESLLFHGYGKQSVCGKKNRWRSAFDTTHDEKQQP